jgi:hypothetical protein
MAATERSPNSLVLAATRPAVLRQAPALLEGDESLSTDPLPVGSVTD